MSKEKDSKNKKISKKKFTENKKKIKKISLEEKFEEADNKYKRALADYQNLLKQTAKEKEEFAKFANQQLLFEILPVFDNLKISLMHIDKEAKDNGWAEGIKYVVKQFRDVLTNIGVEEIKTIGEEYDHNTMEVIEGKGDKVKKEVKSGYKLNGKVIIPAKVVLE